MAKEKIIRLKNLKDNAEFKLSKRSNVYYRLDRKKGAWATITSEGSGRTFVKLAMTVCFPAEC